MNTTLGRQVENLGQRIKDFFTSLASEIRRSPGQKKTPGLGPNVYIICLDMTRDVLASFSLLQPITARKIPFNIHPKSG